MSIDGLFKLMMMDIILVDYTSSKQITCGDISHLLRVCNLGREIWQSHGV